MSNEMQVFNNDQFGKIRAITRDGEPWFVAVDVCNALSISNSRDAVRKLDEDEKMTVDLTDTHSGARGGAQKISAVNESGLYSLVLGSRKPEAKEFKRWVTHEVIPSICKHGAYMTPETLAKAVLNPDVMIQICTALKAEQDKNQKLNAQLEEQKPKVAFADMAVKSKDNVLIRQMAKLLCDNGVKIGEKRLYALLREKKVLMQNNEPYQQYVDRGYFVVVERIIATSYGYQFKCTTKITPAGQIWLTNMCPRWNNESERGTENE